MDRVRWIKVCNFFSLIWVLFRLSAFSLSLLNRASQHTVVSNGNKGRLTNYNCISHMPNCSTRPFLRVWVPGHNPDIPGIPKNALSLITLLQKKGCFRHLALNLTPPGRVRTGGDDPLSFEECWPLEVNARLPQHPHQRQEIPNPSRES